MKKAAIILTLFLISGLAFQTFVYSESSSKKEEVLFYCQQYPEGLLDYAEDNFERMVSSTVGGKNIQISSQDVSMGTPFSVYVPGESPSVFFFPVISNDKIVSLYTVGIDLNASRESSSNHFLCSISSNGIDVIEQVCNQAMPGERVLVYREEHNHTMVRVGGQTILLWRCPGVLEEPSYSLIEIPERSASAVSIFDTIYTIRLPENIEYATIVSPTDIVKTSTSDD